MTGRPVHAPTGPPPRRVGFFSRPGPAGRRIGYTSAMDDFKPSVFDRLTDPLLQPGRPRYSLRAFEDAVRRDLTDLLNATRPPNGFFDGLPEVEQSIANFGLRDVTGMDGNSPAVREGFADHIKVVIETYEPRLTDVAVTPRDPDEVREQDGRNFRLSALYFRIRGTLNVDPTPVDGVTFDTVLELVSRRYDVRLPGGGG